MIHFFSALFLVPSTPDREKWPQVSKIREKGWPKAPKRCKKDGWTARGCGGMKVARGETTARGLLERCRPTARKLPGWTCRESARDPQGLCKRIAGNLQGNCRETARGLAGHLQEMCEGIAGNLRKDRNRTARALQESLRAPCQQGMFNAPQRACRGTAGKLQDNCKGKPKGTS